MEINCGFGFKSWGLQQSKKETTLSVVSFLSWRAQKDCLATLQNLLRQTGVIPPFCCGSNPHVSGSNPCACNNLKKKPPYRWYLFYLGAPRRIRTLNLLIRSQMLYPIEPWAQFALYSIAFYANCK